MEFEFELYVIDDAWKQCSLTVSPKVRCGFHAVVAVEMKLGVESAYMWRCSEHANIVRIEKDGSTVIGDYTRVMYRRK